MEGFRSSVSKISAIYSELWCERRERERRNHAMATGLSGHATDPVVREVAAVEIFKVHSFIINR